MTQAKHTPGPWLVTPNFPKGMTTVCQHTGTGWKSVADCHAAGRDDVECAANATLICAAPDLLAANIQLVDVVKQLLEQIEKVKCGEWKPISICTSAAKVFAEDARAVIAKATGGAA